MSELTQLRPLGKKQSLPDLMMAIKTQAWIFEKPTEKLIIFGCFAWTVYSIFKFLITLL